MTTLAESINTSHEVDRGIFVTPRVPQGLAAAVESLTRAVIKQHPKDIYIFAAQHFENLLRQRDYYRCDKNDDCETVAKNHNNGYDGCKVGKNSMIKSLNKHSRMSKINNMNVTIRPKIMTEMQEFNNQKVTNSNIDKITGHAINKLAIVNSVDNLQKMNYVSEVENAVDRYNIKKHNFEAKLDETRNLLENISSCFSMKHKDYHRPHSADAISHDKHLVTNKLQVMLSETHQLLADISASFLDGSLFSHAHVSCNLKKKVTSIPCVLPSVHSTAISLSTQENAALLDGNMKQNTNVYDNAKSISKIVALPPVMINCTIETAPILNQLDKSRQNLTLPVLANHLDYDEGKFKNNTDLSNANEHYVPINKCIEENSSCNNHQDVVMIRSDIIPSLLRKTTTAAAAAANGSLNKIIREEKLHHQHLDLHSIDEEENPINEYCDKKEANDIDNMYIIEDEFKYDEDFATRSINYKDINVKRYDDGENQSEESSSVKETSFTDAIILESTTCIEHSETGNDFSVSTEVECESSNEAKETTLTDGISLSLDDNAMMRPFIPELNLDSLQDLTVSSFKMMEDDLCEDNTNSVIETPSSSNKYYQCDEEAPNLEIEANNSLDNMEMGRMEKLGCNLHEVNTIYGSVSLSEESRCTIRRMNSQNLVCDNENENETLAVELSGRNVEMMNYDGNNIFGKDVYDELSFVVAIIKIQACIRGFLTRRRYQSIMMNPLQTAIGVDAQQQGEKKILEYRNFDTRIVRNDFRGYHVGKRLCRVNAIIEHTVTMSMDDDDVNENNKLQHTGEFHDWIVLPLHVYDTLVDNEENKVVEIMEKMGEANVMMLERDDSNDYSEIVIREKVVKNEKMKHIIACNELYNEFKWFSHLSIFHIDWNAIMSDITMENLQLLCNNAILYVQQNHDRKLMLSCSSGEGVIIQEITDSPTEKLVEEKFGRTTVLDENDEDEKI